MSYTPGPWRYAQNEGRYYVQSQHVRHVNANGFNWHDVASLCGSNGCLEEDAKLIAAAPELGDALQRLMGRYVHDGGEVLLPEYQAACGALAKAGL